MPRLLPAQRFAATMTGTLMTANGSENLDRLGAACNPPAGQTADTQGQRSTPSWRRPTLYPEIYAWFVLLASLDVMLTWVILHLDGSELNLVANWIIERYDLKGVVIYKFTLVLLVVLICELVGRRDPQRGLQLARWAVVLTAVPVLIALVHLVTALAADLT